ncbi:hypothetical protein HGRIS_005594 [Hohenbuehelia grisea]|uniref:Uncharacterized protein n=1 Tax=Hohenbuehelia grisea TaxID=104357 RepID=A0ABR3JXA7_9AGAR
MGIITCGRNSASPSKQKEQTDAAATPVIGRNRIDTSMETSVDSLFTMKAVQHAIYLLPSFPWERHSRRIFVLRLARDDSLCFLISADTSASCIELRFNAACLLAQCDYKC